MRVLIIEDEAMIADFLEKSIVAEFFCVDMSSDGEEGSYLARTNDYDIVVLDNLLPRKSGLEVCKEIRESGKTMPIIVLSVEHSVPVKMEFLNAGADDYLTKPFLFGELLARMRALLRRSSQMHGQVLAADDLLLDTHRHTVERAKKEIHLTRKEFMLLEYLLHNTDSVVSRRMILEHVWNMDTDPFSNTIESHIKSLRKKVDRGYRRPLIQTISGVGYKLSARK
ncbi:MAG TPA: response regulator transcription factor [Candidatus Paceibacterota bacterium]|nr:response regulator transcription factor [Candidatus Paceibacterota bacterium]